jgi:hypothetical protein
MDDFVSLSNRLLNRCPAIGYQLAQQFINDSWHSLQARREWSFRRQYGTFAPPTQYNTGTASTNAGAGNPTLITGSGTVWTPQMVGTQIRIGGLLYPYYTIVGYISPTELLVNAPWAGPDVSGQSYYIIQAYYPVPDNFGYMYAVVSLKDGYRLWLNLTENDLAILDPQRTNYGQTYAAVYQGYNPIYGGYIGPVIPVTSQTDPAPISTTTTGYTYVSNATYIVQVATGGPVGTATFNWLRSGQLSFQPGPTVTSNTPQNLMDGVQIYWPDAVYVAGDLFVINAVSSTVSGSILYELWPTPSYSGYLYPYIYVAKEYDLTVSQPTLPPLIANRGEVLLEAGLEKCAEFPGQDSDHPNIYHNLVQARYHQTKYMNMLVDLERNDEEVGVSLIDYEIYPYAPAPWMDGQWQQTHAPFLVG